MMINSVILGFEEENVNCQRGYHYVKKQKTKTNIQNQNECT